MDATLITYVIVSGVIGIIAGYVICFFTSKKHDKGRLEDELTNAKRDLARQKQIMNDFFMGASSLFEQFDNSYQAYATYMDEQSRKLMPQLGTMFKPSSNPAVKNFNFDNIQPNNKSEEQTAELKTTTVINNDISSVTTANDNNTSINASTDNNKATNVNKMKQPVIQATDKEN